MSWLSGFDLMWDTRSGDSFADIYGLARHTKMSLIHEFAVQAGLPVVLAPQTIGPFRTRRGRLLARRNLRRSVLVFARDSASGDAAARLGRPVDAVATDLVFGIDQPAPAPQRDVLLNVSGLLWGSNAHGDPARYQTAVRGIVDALRADGRAVTLLPHVIDSPGLDNDVPVSRRLSDELGLDLYIPANLDDARATIASSSLLIGARMHACLNALSTGTPAVAMAYSRKFQPLLNAIGWDEVVPLASDDVAAEVLRSARTSDLRERAGITQRTAQRLLAPVAERLEELA